MADFGADDPVDQRLTTFWQDRGGSKPSAKPAASPYERNKQWVKPGDQSYNTALPADQETKFRAWLKSNDVPFDPAAKTTDYDMRGFWKALQSGDPKAKQAIDPNDDRMHYPDYWKTPYHATFSNESQWADPKKAPKWNDKDQLVTPDGAVIFDDRAQGKRSPGQRSEAPADTMTISAGKPLGREALVSKWVDRGYPKPAAEGIVDNMLRESGGSSSIIGDGGTSGGLFQHHATRLDELKAYAEKQGKPWTDPDLQIDFADQEMKTKFPKLRESMLAATDRGAAEDQFKRVFERPASVMWANRADGSGPVLEAPGYRFSDYALGEHAGKRNTSLLMMSPEDYLALSPPMDGDAASSRNGKALRASLARGDEVEAVPTMAMKVGQDGSAEVTGQDGRHRAQLAAESGVDAIPVAVKRTGADAEPTEVVGMGGKILPHDFQPHPAAAKRAGVMDWLFPPAEAAEPGKAGHVTFGADDPPASFGADDKPGGDQRSILDRIGTGLLDPAVGLAQLAANIPLPTDFIPGSLGAASRASTDAVNAAVANRERTIQGERGGDTGIDWWRLGGNVVNPINLVPMAALGRAGSLGGTLLRAGLAGAAAGAEQPVTEGSYGTGKAEQIAIGTVGGVAAGIGAELVGRALGAVADPIARWFGGLVGDKLSNVPIAARTAVREVLRRIEGDTKGGGPTTQDMLDLVNATPHKPLTLADVGGKGVLNLAGRMARAPGEAAQIMAKSLDERDAGAGTRLVSDVDSGIAGGSAYDAATALSQARSAAAQPKYEEAFGVKLAMKDVRPIQRFIQDPIGQDALQKGMRVMEVESLKVGGGAPFDPAKYGVVRGQSGAWIIDPDVLAGKKAPSMRLLDAVKRGYDEIVEGFRNETTGKLQLNQYGRAVNQARADYTGYLRTNFKKYGEALDAWAGPSQSLDALRAGQGFLQQRPEEIARRLASIKSPNDREFFKMGAADTLRTKLAQKGPTADEAKAILRSDYMRQQLRPLFDDDASFDRFVKSVEAEGRMFGTRFEVLRGSHTAARQAEDRGPEAEAMAHAARGATNAVHGNYLGMIGNALRAITTLAKAPDPAHQAAIAKLITTPLTPGSAGMDLLQNYASILPKTRNMMLQGARVAAPAIAPTAGLLTGPSQ